MFNKIKSKIEFAVPSEERVQEIYDSICVDNEFDFKSVGGCADFSVYCYVMGRELDKVDYWELNVYSWISDFWKSEYRTCEISKLEYSGEKASFTFQTLWRVPYPVVAAFAYKFKVPFILKHMEINGKYWGIEIFELDENERVRKTSDRVCMEEDFRDLHIELMGYEPEEYEDSAHQDRESEKVESA